MPSTYNRPGTCQMEDQDRMRHSESQNSWNNDRQTGRPYRVRSTVPVPRPALDSWSARTARLRGARGHIALSMDRGTSRVEVEKLNVDAGPVDQIGSGSMLAKRPIVGKPNATGKLTISLENQHLVLAEVLPTMRKVPWRNQHEGRECLHPCCYVLNAALTLLGARINTKRLSNNSCGSGSVSTMLVDRGSSNSRNFPDTICGTIFAEIGENPGPPTNGWWRIGTGLAADDVSTTDWGNGSWTSSRRHKWRS